MIFLSYTAYSEQFLTFGYANLQKEIIQNPM